MSSSCSSSSRSQTKVALVSLRSRPRLSVTVFVSVHMTPLRHGVSAAVGGGNVQPWSVIGLRSAGGHATGSPVVVDTARGHKVAVAVARESADGGGGGCCTG